MPAYANRSGRSGVVSYDADPAGQWIDVTFRNGRTYTYDTYSCGINAVTDMIALAQAGRGLSTYIAQNRPPHV